MPWKHGVTSCSRHLAGTAYFKGGRRPCFGQARPSKYGTHLEPHPSPRLQYQHEVLYVLGVFMGLVMWGFGLVWLAFALISIATTVPKGLPFNMGWWGFTFPLGVLATCTGALARNLGGEFFGVATMVGIGCLKEGYLLTETRSFRLPSCCSGLWLLSGRLGWSGRARCSLPPA